MSNSNATGVNATMLNNSADESAPQVPMELSTTFTIAGTIDSFESNRSFFSVGLATAFAIAVDDVRILNVSAASIYVLVAMLLPNITRAEAVAAYLQQPSAMVELSAALGVQVEAIAPPALAFMNESLASWDSDGGGLSTTEQTEDHQRGTRYSHGLR